MTGDVNKKPEVFMRVNLLPLYARAATVEDLQECVVSQLSHLTHLHHTGCRIEFQQSKGKLHTFVLE